MVRFLPSVRVFICYSVKVYLLPVNGLLMLIGRILLGEYVCPSISDNKGFTVTHSPAKAVDAGKDLRIEAIVAGNEMPDSVIIYTDKISFWNEKNPYLKMESCRRVTHLSCYHTCYRDKRGLF